MMYKQLVALVIILVISLCNNVFAQAGDDFSGVWTNNPPEENRGFQNSALRADPPPMTPVGASTV